MYAVQCSTVTISHIVDIRRVFHRTKGEKILEIFYYDYYLSQKFLNVNYLLYGYVKYYIIVLNSSSAIIIVLNAIIHVFNVIFI